jgi:hypothetical protein
MGRDGEWREQRALPGAAERDGRPARRGLDGAEQPDLETSLHGLYVAEHNGVR